MRAKILATTLLLLSAGVLWWHATGEDATAAASTPTAVHPSSVAQAARPKEPTPPARAASIAGAPVLIDPFLTPDLRYRLEAVLHEAGDAGTPQLLKQRAAALVHSQFQPDERVRALQLLERYIDYRVAMSALVPPADLSDPRAVRALLDARRRVRERHFDQDEYRTLFATEEELDRFTLSRLEIARQPQLDETQKAAATQRAAASLGDDTRQVRAEVVKHHAVADQTQALDARGASDSERYEERRKAYGDEAASRLATLDREQREWNERLDRYQVALRDLPAAEAATLRSQLFTAEEQLRLEGALARRAQAASPSNARAR
jgi:lipase chaperone LimK